MYSAKSERLNHKSMILIRLVVALPHFKLSAKNNLEIDTIVSTVFVIRIYSAIFYFIFTFPIWNIFMGD